MGQSQDARKVPWVLLYTVQEEAVRAEHWVIGTIFRLSRTETVEVAVRADAPGLTSLGWSGIRNRSARCKETTNEVWSVVGPLCLSPTPGKRQRRQIRERTLLIRFEAGNFPPNYISCGKNVCQRGPCRRSDGSRVKMGSSGNFCILGELRLNVASAEGRGAISWPFAGGLAACPETEGKRNPRALFVAPVPRINADRVQSAVSLGGSKMTFSFS